MTLKKLTPVVIVDEIEPALPFWTGRLGFEKTAEVPDGDRLGFVILSRDGIEVMLQTVASVESDAPALAPDPAGHSVTLYFEVEDLDPVAGTLADADVVLQRRTTFYGADEIGVRAPGGVVVVFAAFGEGQGEG